MKRAFGVGHTDLEIGDRVELVGPHGDDVVDRLRMIQELDTLKQTIHFEFHLLYLNLWVGRDAIAKRLA